MLFILNKRIHFYEPEFLPFSDIFQLEIVIAY